MLPRIEAYSSQHRAGSNIPDTMYRDSPYPDIPADEYSFPVQGMFHFKAASVGSAQHIEIECADKMLERCVGIFFGKSQPSARTGRPQKARARMRIPSAGME